MFFKNKKYSVIFHAISVLLVHAFLLSDVAFALDRHTLAPPSRFWDEETVRSVRDGETYGKSFRNRVAFREISMLIGQDLHRDPQKHMKEPIDSTARARAMINEIREHVDAAELAISKTRGDLDPILYGFELDELTYNQDENTYYLPLYRNEKPAYYYKFYIGEKSENPDDWTILLGNGKSVYVKVRAVYEAEISQSEKAERIAIAIRSFWHDIFFKVTRNFGSARLTVNMILYLLMHDYVKDETVKSRINELEQRMHAVFGSLVEAYDDIRDMAKRKIALDYSKAWHWHQTLLNLYNEMIALKKEYDEIFDDSNLSKIKFDSVTLDKFHDFVTRKRNTLTMFEDMLRQQLMFIDGKIEDKIVDINSIVDNFTNIIPQREEYIFAVEGDSLQPVRGNEQGLMFMLVNLVSNAMKFSRQTNQDKPKVIVKKRIDGNFDVIEISDNGPGMTAEQIANLGYGYSTTGSTGIGFAEARFIAKDHGGTIEVESEPGKGMTFTIRLPVAERERTGFELNKSHNRNQIVARNRQYLKSKGWLELIEELPYQPLFIFEDEKTPEFLDKITSVKKTQMKLKVLFSTPLDEKPVLPTDEDFKQNMDASIVPLAHLLQSIYFYSQGRNSDAEQAYQTAKRLNKENEVCATFTSGSKSDCFYLLAEMIYAPGIDRDRARYLFRLGLEFFNWEEENQALPENFAMNLAALDLAGQEKRGITIVKSVLPIHNRFASERLPDLAKSDTEFGRRLLAHFEETKKKTMEASSYVTRSGVALVLGAGSFVVLPLAEMFRERLPDGSLKYEKIILIELAEDFSEGALERLVREGRITHEEAQRVEIINADATLILDSILRKIDEIMTVELKTNRDSEVPPEKLIELFEEISTPEGLANYVLPVEKRPLRNDSIIFAVYAMSIQDFVKPIKDYINSWSKFFLPSSGVNKALQEWGRYSNRIQRSITSVVLRDLARISKPGGIVFLADATGTVEMVFEDLQQAQANFMASFTVDDLTKVLGEKDATAFLETSEATLRNLERDKKQVRRTDFYGAEGLRELVPHNLPFEMVTQSSWERPLNVFAKSSRSHFKIESLTLRKHTDTISVSISPQSEQIHPLNFAKEIEQEPKPSFIALGTSWIKGYEKDRYLQYDALNPLIASIRKYCEEKHIPFINGDDDEVAKQVLDIKAKDPNARGVVLAGQKTIDKIGLENDQNVLLAGVDNKNLTIDSYIRLMEMLTLTVQLFQAKIQNRPIDEGAIKEKHKHLGIQFINGIIIFMPDAAPMDYEELREVYKLQTFA